MKTQLLKIIKWSIPALIGISMLIIFILSARELFHTNSGESISHGTRFDGWLENGWLMPYSGDNFKSFSSFSYYLMDNAYLNDKVQRAVTESYKICETTAPGITFRYMEASDHSGGPVYFHHSHRNGLSIDFMVPKIKDGKPYTSLDGWGLAHYFLEFDNDGCLRPIYPYLNNIHPALSRWVGQHWLDDDVKIDFESMARHILALDDACKKENIAILKVILKIELLDEFYSTPSGRKVKARGIPFASKLTTAVNGMHDDHYHVDFRVN